MNDGEGMLFSSWSVLFRVVPNATSTACLHNAGGLAHICTSGEVLCAGISVQCTSRESPKKYSIELVNRLPCCSDSERTYSSPKERNATFSTRGSNSGLAGPLAVSNVRVLALCTETMDCIAITATTATAVAAGGRWEASIVRRRCAIALRSRSWRTRHNSCLRYSVVCSRCCPVNLYTSRNEFLNHHARLECSNVRCTASFLMQSKDMSGLSFLFLMGRYLVILCFEGVGLDLLPTASRQGVVVLFPPWLCRYATRKARWNRENQRAPAGPIVDSPSRHVIGSR